MAAIRFQFALPRDGEDEGHEVPGRWAICARCRGEGSVDNPAFSNGFTSDEWERMDYEEREDYLSGVYDVPCSTCRGEGKLIEPDVGRCTTQQKRLLVLHRRAEREKAMWDAEWRAERRAEARMLGEEL